MLFISTALLSLVSLTVAQSSAAASGAPTTQPAIPTCVSGCFAATASIAAGCTATDISCLCKSSPFVVALATCFQTTCTSAADAAYGIQFGIATCAAVGVTVTAPAAPVSGVSTSAAASSAAISSAAASSAAAVTTAAPASSTAVVVPVATSTKSGSNKLVVSSGLLATLVTAFYVL